MRFLVRVLFRICVLWSGAFVFFFSPQVFAYMGNICLSPIERAVLFSGTGSRSSGKTSYKSKIRSLNANISVIERRIEKRENKLKQATDKLANSLNGRELGQDADEVADSVTDYMKYEQSGWGCQEESSGGSVFLYPSFLPGVFGPLLPLLWEGTPVYATNNVRRGTVKFSPGESPANAKDCLAVNGTWLKPPSNTCNMISVWNKCKQYKNKGLGYQGITVQGECVCAGGVLCEEEKKKRKIKEEARDKGWDELEKIRKKHRALQKADERLIEMDKKWKASQMKKCRQQFPGFPVRGVKGKNCLCQRGMASTASCQGLKNKCESYKSYKSVESVQVDTKGNCMCRWKGPKTVLLPCTEVEKIKENVQDREQKTLAKKAKERAAKEAERQKALGVCNIRYKNFSVTQAYFTPSGLKCYCGAQKQTCSKIAGCKAKHGESFTHIDSSGDCMCGDDPCSAHQSGRRLQKCINKNEDIYPSGVTLHTNGRTCQCGSTACDELRKKIRGCNKEYESFGYTEFKSGYCMCGNRRCKDKKREDKSAKDLSEKCVKQFPGLIVTRGFKPGRGRGLLKCDCIHKGKIQSCGQIRAYLKKKKTNCLRRYGKHLRTGVTSITFKNGRCFCDNAICGLRGYP